MLTRDNFRGLFILLVTPMDAEMRIDYAAHYENVRRLVALGVDGIVLNPSWNGETQVCTDDERERLLHIAAEETRGRALCVADCSAPGTVAAVQRARRAVELGADGLMCTVPYGVALSKAERLQFWRDLAAAVPEAGIAVYNRPGSGLMTQEDFASLADVANFVGSKLSGGPVEYTGYLRNTPHRHLALEALWSMTKPNGGDGVAAAWIYGCPQYMMRWWRAICADDTAAAATMQDEVNRLLQHVVLSPMRAGYCEPATLKAFIDAMGVFHAGPVRKPSFSVPTEELVRIRAVVESEFPQFLR